MKFLDIVMILLVLVLVIGGLAVVVIGTVGVFEIAENEGTMKAFCEDRGYTYRSSQSDCYKIQNDKLITKSIKVIDKEVYFEE